MTLADLREPISLVRACSIPDNGAEWIDKIKKYANVRAGVDEGSYSIQDDKISSADLFVFVIRYSPDLRPALGDWVVWGREVFAIKSFRRRSKGIDHTEINALHSRTLPDNITDAVEIDNSIDTTNTDKELSTEPPASIWED